MTFSDYLEKKLLDEVFGATDFLAPATVYVGLSTSATIDDTVTGTTVVEPSGAAGYARVAVTNNATNWPAATGTGDGGSQKKNANAVTFPTATGNWGTVQTFFIADAATLGNILVSGALTTAKTVNNGDTASFAANQITITLD